MSNNVLPSRFVKRLQKLARMYPVEFEECLEEHPEWIKSSFKGDIPLDRVKKLYYKGDLNLTDAIKDLIEALKGKAHIGFFSFFKKRQGPVDLLKETIKQNPYGLQLVLLKNNLNWSKCGIGGDIHLGKYNELKYSGIKTLRDAVLELTEELKTPVSLEDLNAERSFQPRTRKILATLDADQQINIGTEEKPIFVTLTYDWYYYEDGVHVNVVDGYSTPRFGGKNHGCISWREMYGYVCSLSPGKDGGRAWFRPRIARKE